MSKTLELRKLIMQKLNTTTGYTYYQTASKDTGFPYKVFSFENIDLGDINRDDLILEVNVYTKDADQVDSIADTIEPLFNAVNSPTGKILPTFFRLSRKPIPDEDITIHRVQLRFQIQNYERSV
jgi:hypothetical protein